MQFTIKILLENYWEMYDTTANTLSFRYHHLLLLIIYYWMMMWYALFSIFCVIVEKVKIQIFYVYPKMNFFYISVVDVEYFQLNERAISWSRYIQAMYFLYQKVGNILYNVTLMGNSKQTCITRYKRQLKQLVSCH